jgi:transposase
LTTATKTLPAYAPELNPVEAIWAYRKKHEIANLCLDTIDFYNNHECTMYWPNTPIFPVKT